MSGHGLAVLHAEYECVENEGDNDGHDHHGDEVEEHEVDATPLGELGRVAVHDDVPVVDHRQLKQRHCSKRNKCTCTTHTEYVQTYKTWKSTFSLNV